MNVPSHIQKIKPYPPGKPIDELKRELGVEEPIKLASNENPLGPSPLALKAMEESLTSVNRYPDGSAYYLRRKISEVFSIPFEGIVVGNGSNELIEMSFKAFTRYGEGVVVPEPSFLMYSLTARVLGLNVKGVALRDFRLDLEAMVDAVDSSIRVVIVNNPNNPTGTIVKKDEWEEFLSRLPKDIFVILDEAYIEFVTDEDCPIGTDYIDTKGPKVIVIRTFSKAYGLAGLRIGYCMTSPDVADYLNRVRQPFNVNSLAQAAALAALDDEDFIKRTRALVLNQLDFLYSELKKLGLNYVPTQTNFFLIEMPVSARLVYERLLKKGIIARAMDSYGLGKYLRVSVGLEEENRLFLAKLAEVLNEVA